ncbi:MAG: ABC transporter permease [Hyphomicrobiales bacterium]|nr:ABC transporter permease [Hyphomicrobiales bacterium]
MTPLFVLTPRPFVSPLRRVLTPVCALAAALAIGGVIVALLGRSPAAAFRVFLVEPLTDPWAAQEVLLKATPLVLIATGLLFCFRASRWNIGAEGQFLVGGLCGGGIAILTHGMTGAWILPAMMLAGACGGLAYAALPALLRVRFGISEILTSLMLVYVADLLLDYLVRGPWRDPKGFNFPQSVAFSDAALLHPLLEGGRLHAGMILALAAALAAALVFRRTLFGFAIAASGEAPRAANFAGFNEGRITVLVFLISGALAGLAGVIEVAGQVGQLRPGFGQGLGFTAIIVAFLGRLSPLGAVLAALVIAVLLIGAESAQVSLKLPLDLARFFMGLLLICILLGESLERYRIRFRRAEKERQA